MSNLRIVYNNIADKASTIWSSSTEGSLGVTNLLNNYKGKPHRSASTSVSYLLTWDTPQVIGVVILPCTNLSSTSTIRVRLYSDTLGTAPIDTTPGIGKELSDSLGEGLILDSGTLAAVYSNEVATPTDVTRFAFGEYSKSSVWFPAKPSNVKVCQIDIQDSANPVGYIDCSRLVIGDYWTPTYNFEPGLSREVPDNSEVVRAYSGETRAYVKPKYEKISFNFSLLPEQDYVELNRILNYVGVTKNLVVALMPEYSDNKIIENYYLIYGKRANNSYTYSTYKYYNSQLEIESW